MLVVDFQTIPKEVGYFLKCASSDFVPRLTSKEQQYGGLEEAFEIRQKPLLLLLWYVGPVA